LRPRRGKPEALVTLPFTSRRTMERVKKEDGNLYGRLTENEYINFLVGKRIIIVGPAGYLQGKGLGEWIDSFDIVVRINHAIPIKYPKDYGSRTDVLYHILSHRGGDGFHKVLVSKNEILLWKKEKLQWLVSKHEAMSKRIRDMEKIIDGNLQWITLTRMFNRRVRSMVGGSKTPNTGTYAVIHLLEKNIKELQITGFDFYRTGVYTGYGDIKSNEDAIKVNKIWHELEPQVEYFRKIYKRDVRLKIDDTLKGILKVDR